VCILYQGTRLRKKCCGALERAGLQPRPSSFYIWIPSGAGVDNGPLPHAGEGGCQLIFRRQTKMYKL